MAPGWLGVCRPAEGGDDELRNDVVLGSWMLPCFHAVLVTQVDLSLWQDLIALESSGPMLLVEVRV